MALLSRALTWRLVSAGAAMAAGWALRRGLNVGWRGVRRQEPPRNPVSPEVSWPNALAWSMAVGAAAGLARVLARRGAASGWRTATGQYPPGIRQRRGFSLRGNGGFSFRRRRRRRFSFI